MCARFQGLTRKKHVRNRMCITDFFEALHSTRTSPNYVRFVDLRRNSCEHLAWFPYKPSVYETWINFEVYTRTYVYETFYCEKPDNCFQHGVIYLRHWLVGTHFPPIWRYHESLKRKKQVLYKNVMVFRYLPVVSLVLQQYHGLS